MVGPIVTFWNLLTGIPITFDFSDAGAPSVYKFYCQFFFCVFVLDFFFHMNHRLFHTSFFYKRFHKIHHRYKVTLFCATTYCHPVEMVICNLIPAGIGPMLLGAQMHVTAVMGYFLLAALGAIIDHCGYEFTFSPFRMVPFSCHYGYHVFHHSHNVGNYSTVWHLWDTLLSSNSEYWQALDDHSEVRKKRIKNQKHH